MSEDRGRFIVFEGGEGAGKTSVMCALEKLLKREHLNVVKTREPGATPLGERIRALLLQSDGAPLCSKSELLLFLAARAQNIEEVIAPALERGEWVICDRFNASTIAYQGYARGLGVDEVDRLCAWTCGSIVPDITVYLDVDPVLGLKRASRTAAKDRIENEALAFHRKVREGFHAVAKKHSERFIIIDAHQPKKDVIEEAWALIMKMCN